MIGFFIGSVGGEEEFVEVKGRVGVGFRILLPFLFVNLSFRFCKFRFQSFKTMNPN